MNRLLLSILFFLILPAATLCQKVTYSDYEQEDNKEINFEIIGKMNGNFLVYKNARWRHKINIFGDDMKIKETVKLDFIPDRTFNVDFVIYPTHFFMIYQYQKKNILHCMGVKMDAEGKKMGEPVELDTTHISILADNKIYSTIYSEDKQKIVVFKIHKKYESFNIVTLLFNNNLKLIANKNRQSLEFNDRRDSYDNYLVDNDGNFIFTKDSKNGNRDNSNALTLIMKDPQQDTFAFHDIDMGNNYIDEVKLKIDNLNKRYILNSFYYKKSRGNIDGLFTCVWDKAATKVFTQGFTVLNDTLRDEAKKSGQLRFALDDFFIRQVFVKKDGGFLLTAEDYSSQRSGSNNSWNRWDYLNNYYYSPYSSSSYYYNPYYGYYRPYGGFNNNQNTRYYYSNIIVLSADKTGKIDWSKVIHKEQFDDNDDNFLSFSNMNSGGQIHFLFNDDKNKNQIIANHSISASGELTRNPTLKSQERGYQFMTRFGKQVGASQILIPCIYRNYICFAKVDF
jgi:hypothetical protein